MRLQTKALKGALLGFGLLALVALTGCPGLNAPQTSQVTVLFTADGAVEEAKSLPAGYAEKARVVMVEEILSLLVTVDEIYFERATDTGIDPVTVVSEPFDLDLVSLLGITEVIDSVTLPVGDYVGAVMMLSNARLTLADAPDTVRVDVNLLDGGVLRVATEFVATENGMGLLLLDLGGINLAELDAGGFDLIPDLRVDLFNTDMQAQAIGEVAEVRRDFEEFVLHKRHARMEVGYTNAVVFLPDDFNAPNGTPEDITVGAKVFVFGTLNFDGSLDASVVVILRFGHPEDEFEGEGEHEGEGDGETEGEGDGETEGEGEGDGETEGEGEGEGEPEPDFEFHAEFKLYGTDADPEAMGWVGYYANPEARHLVIEMENIWSAESVFVLFNGDIVEDAHLVEGMARIELDTREGQHVPLLHNGSIVEVVNAETSELILTTHPREPEVFEHHFKLFATDAYPDAVGGGVYYASPDRRKLVIEVGHLLPLEAVFVYVDNVLADDLHLVDGMGRLYLDTAEGHEVPEVRSDSVITVWTVEGEVLVLTSAPLAGDEEPV